MLKHYWPSLSRLGASTVQYLIAVLPPHKIGAGRARYRTHRTTKLYERRGWPKTNTHVVLVPGHPGWNLELGTDRTKRITAIFCQ